MPVNIIPSLDVSASVGNVVDNFVGLTEQGADPAVLADTGFVYTKDVLGVTQLFYRADDGTVSQLTPSAAGSPWVQGGNAFGATGVFGTNDAFDINVRTSGTTRFNIESGGNLEYFDSLGGTLAYIDFANRHFIVGGTEDLLGFPGLPQFIVEDEGGLDTVSVIWNIGGAGENAFLGIVKGNGTLAAPTGLVDGDEMGGIVWTGWDSTNTFQFNPPSVIQVVVDGTVAAGIIPTRMNFLVTDDTGAAHIFMVARSTGFVGINQQNPTAQLHVFSDTSSVGIIEFEDASVGTTQFVLDLRRFTSGVATAGIGAGLIYTLEDDAGVSVQSGSVAVILDDVTNGAVDARMQFSIRLDDVFTDIFAARETVLAGATVFDLVPQGDDTGNLGEDVTPLRWASLHVGTGPHTLDGDTTIDGKLTVTGAIDPTQVLLTGASKKFGATDAGTVFMSPFADSTTAVEIRRADGVTAVFRADTTNQRLLLSDGTAALPNGFLSSTTTGLFRQAADSIGVAIAGVEAYRIDASSNLTMRGDFDFTPSVDNQGELGTDALRWTRVRAVTVTTGDLVLRDDDVGAHWIVKEGTDGIYAVNQANGERYRLVMEKING